MSEHSTWRADALPDAHGRVFLITGATAGLGFFASEQLARSGATVIMSGRNPNRLAAARAAVMRRVPDASTESILLDLTKAGSVHAAAATLRARDRLDGVLLNAGLVHTPKQREEAEGNELTLQTNVLGHFALAGDLLPRLIATAKNHHRVARMVWLGSISVASWRAPEFDVQLDEGYNGVKAYVQSKFLVQAIAAEADRRFRAAALPVASIIAHPGYSLGGRSPGVAGVNEPSRWKRFGANLQASFAQSKERGAEAEVRALLDPDVQSGDLVGPARALRGATSISGRDDGARITRLSGQPEVGAWAWRMAEAASHAKWPSIVR